MTADDFDAPPLTLVPDQESGVSDQRAAVARWVINLCEPLIATDTRAVVDDDMAKVVERAPKWVELWFAGWLRDLAMTLPADDPWRNLSATLDLSDLAPPFGDSVHEHGANPPPDTGARREDGEPFGSLYDSSDLVMPEQRDSTTDFTLAAVVEPLRPESAAILGLTGSTAEKLSGALGSLFHGLWIASLRKSGKPAGPEFLAIVGAAVRWLAHRRRVYVGLDDPFVCVSGFAWMARADRLLAGTGVVTDDLALVQTGQIDESAYRDLRGI
ncbi:MAG: hypothetical protein ACRCYU_23485 [Nocardioides sp.]